MDKQSTDPKEETLVAMLASLHKETCYHDTFEEDFLRNFHIRMETEQATSSVWKSFLERLDNYLQNFRGWQWVYASMFIVTLVAVGVIIVSEDMGEPSGPYASSTKDQEERLLTEQATLVSDENIEIEKPEFTTGVSPDETQTNDNQLKPDSNTDKKQVPRVLIEM